MVRCPSVESDSGKILEGPISRMKAATRMRLKRRRSNNGPERLGIELQNRTKHMPKVYEPFTYIILKLAQTESVQQTIMTMARSLLLLKKERHEL